MKRKVIKNIEARVIPYTIMILMILAAFSASLIMFHDTARAYVGIAVEGFEDDAVGSTLPTEDWYTLGYVNVTNGADLFDVTTDQAKTGSKSLEWKDVDTEVDAFSIAYFNFTTSANISYFNMSIYMIAGDHSDLQFFIKNDSDGFIFRGVIPSKYNVNPSAVDILLQNDTGIFDSNIPVDKDCWTTFNITFNWTSMTYRFLYINETGYKYWTNNSNGLDNKCFWIPMCQSAENSSGFYWRSKVFSGKHAHFYSDDIHIGNMSTVAPPAVSSEFGIRGDYLYNSTVNFSGVSSTTLYSNETEGENGKNVTMYIDVNATENCTDICINISDDLTFGDSNQIDVSDSGNSDIFLQVGTDDTWSNEWVQFQASNNYNISLNTSWDSLSDDSNPFVINDGDGNITIHCIFRVDVGAVSAGLHNTSVTWDVQFKYERSW